MIHKNIKTGKKTCFSAITMLILILAFLFSCTGCKNLLSSAVPSTSQATSAIDAAQKNPAFSVHVIDIGIGDSILVTSGDNSMLIDAGENGQGANSPGKIVETYLKKYGIKSLDWVVGTHPHSDHIGGLDYIIDNIECKNVLMSEMAKNAIPTTKTYTDVLKSIKSKGMKITKAVAGETFALGEATVDILGPMKKYEDLNNTSVVLKITFGETTFLFTGDMENEAEKDLIEAGANLNSDFLKVGHHGSKTSTCSSFLKQVSPSFAAISANDDNKYNHPSKKTTDALTKANVQTYITKESGSIVFSSDGKSITVKTEK